MAQQYDGSIRIDTSINTKGISTGIQSITNTLNKFASVVGVTFSTVAVVNFGKTCVSTAMEIENAIIGLQSIVEGQGRSFAKANSFIQDYIADGLVPLQNAVTAYKNLASRGYTDEQIQNVMIALKNSATYGRQANLTLGDAVQSATEGLKNENSILVDNAGVTKNVSVMWKEYANQIGASYTELTKQQKIQAEVNGILEETQFQIGDAEKASNTFTGQISRLSVSFTNLKSAIGNSIIPVLEKIIPYLNDVILQLTVIFERIANISKALFGNNSNNELSSIASPTVSTNIDNATDSTEDLTSATEDLANAQAELNKEVRGSLASFDKLEVVSFNSPNNTSSNTDDTDILEDNSDAVATLSNATSDLADTTDDYTLSNSKLLDSLKKLKKQLDRLGDFTGQALIDFYEHFLKPLGNWTVNEALPHFIDTLSSAMAKVNWQGINDALIRLWDALEPFAETVGEGLLWFWDNVLTPLGTWVLNKAVPTFLDLLSSSIELLHTVIQVFKPFGLWIWEEFLEPIAKWTGGVIISVLKGITDLIQDFTNYLKDNSDEIQTWIPLVSGIAMAIGSAFAVKGLSKFAPTFLKIGTVIVGVASKVKNLALVFGSLASSEGIIAAITTSVTGLWGVFTAFMTSLSPLAKVGVTVAGIVAIFTTAYSAVKKLSDGSLTLTGALKNIIPVTVAVGVALYAMMGPIGVVIAGISTLVGAYAGAVSATNEAAQNIVSNAVFNDAGTPITEYADTISDLADTISSEQDKILSLGDTIESNNEKITENTTNLSMLVGKFEQSGTMSEENAEQIRQSAQAIADGISENLSTSTQMIIEGLGATFDDLALKSGSAVSNMVADLYLLQNEGDQKLADLMTKINETTYTLQDMDKNSPEYENTKRQFEELYDQLVSYQIATDNTVTSADLLTQTMKNISDADISLMDDATASQVIADMSANYSQAMDDLKEGKAQQLANIQSYQERLDALDIDYDINMFTDMAKQIEESYAKQQDDLENTFTDIKNKISSQVSGSLNDATSKALEEALNTPGGQLDLYGKYIKNLFSGDGVTGALGSALADYQNELKESVAGSTTQALKDAQTTINQKAYENGLNLDKGLVNGINDNAQDAYDSIKKVGDNTITTFKNATDTHSPSQAFIELGTYLMQGLKNGITDNSSMVLNAMKTFSNELINIAQNSLSTIPSCFDTVFSNILYSMNNFNNNLLTGIRDTLNNIINDLNSLFNGINQVNFDLPMGYGNFGVNIPQIPHLATGGLIPPRNEFMAILGDNTRENEIVSPVSAMVDAMKQAIAESGIGNNQNITVNVDGRELFTIIVDKNRQYIKQTGKSAF